MTISIVIDREADAAYIRLSPEPVARTISLTPDVNVDVDKLGVVVGIEVLTLTAQIPYDELIANHHVRSEVVDTLRRIRPSVSTFVSHVQSAPDSDSHAAVGDGQSVTH